MSQELTKAGESAKPAYLQTSAPVGVEAATQIMTPPIVKVRQGLTKDERLKSDFREGDIVLMPDYKLLYTKTKAADGTECPPVSFTPLLMYRQWCVWNPLKAYGELPFIRESTLDPNHDIARKAALMGDERVKEACPEFPSENLQYMEHANFLAMLHLEGASSFPVLLSFASTSYKDGKRLSNLIVGRGADIYAGRYTLKSGERKNSKGEWHGFDVANDEENPWVTEDQFKLFREQHGVLKAKVEAGEVAADYEAGVDLAEETAEAYSESPEM